MPDFLFMKLSPGNSLILNFCISFFEFCSIIYEVRSAKNAMELSLFDYVSVLVRLLCVALYKKSVQCLCFYHYFTLCCGRLTYTHYQPIITTDKTFNSTWRWFTIKCYTPKQNQRARSFFP